MPRVESASRDFGGIIAINLIRVYVAGAMAALEQYAWWRDGVQYVGCGAETLSDARAAWEKLIAGLPDDTPTTEDNNNA